jgi:CRP/FNR family transcriptional regulator, cyclic AMP receptor protein
MYLRSGRRTPASFRLLNIVSTVRLTTVLPEITALIPAGDRQLLDQVLRVPSLHVDGDLADTLTATPTAFDFIVADGVVLKQTRYAGRNSLELLGPGDVLAPPLTPSRQLESRATSSYQAHGQASLAVIEDRFRTAARRWPQLSDVLHDRLARQTHRASMHLAMLHLARAEERVLALFCDLAERLGHVTSDGIVIDVKLTHELIGRLIGSRRPTVSRALEELSTTGTLTRTRNDRWMLNAPDILG